MPRQAGALLRCRRGAPSVSDFLPLEDLAERLRA
jgi:hypothetical protein